MTNSDDDDSFEDVRPPPTPRRKSSKKKTKPSKKGTTSPPPKSPTTTKPKKKPKRSSGEGVPKPPGGASKAKKPKPKESPAPYVSKSSSGSKDRPKQTKPNKKSAKTTSDDKPSNVKTKKTQKKPTSHSSSTEPEEAAPTHSRAVPLATPATLGQNDDDGVAPRKQDVLCGCCCDFRIAALVVLALYPGMVFWAFIWFIPASIGSIEAITDDTPIVEMTTTPFFYLAVFQAVGSTVFWVVGIVGALRFQPNLVLAVLIWLIVDTALCGAMGNLPGMGFRLTWMLYTMLGLYLALKRGLLTREGYASQKHCCNSNAQPVYS